MASRRGGRRRSPRVAGRPAAGANNNTPKFESPYQPPPGNDDLATQVTDLHTRREEKTFGLKTPPTGHLYRHTITTAGEEYRVKTPRPEALHTLTAAVSPHIKDTRLQNDMVQLFVSNHMQPDDFERIIFRMMDPDDAFTKDDLGQLMRSITTLGTARPTVPS